MTRNKKAKRQHQQQPPAGPVVQLFDPSANPFRPPPIFNVVQIAELLCMLIKDPSLSRDDKLDVAPSCNTLFNTVLNMFLKGQHQQLCHFDSVEPEASFAAVQNIDCRLADLLSFTDFHPGST
jgi:hypothetical protein